MAGSVQAATDRNQPAAAWYQRVVRTLLGWLKWCKPALKHAELTAKVLLWLAFGALKVSAIWGQAPAYSGDRRIWADIAQLELSSPSFLFARRPIALPMLYKLVDSDQTIVRLQLGFSIFAWGALAHALSRLSSGVLSVFIFLCTLLTALATPVHSWDLVIRAESTSHSLLALTIAAAVHFLVELPARPRAAYVWAGACAIAGFWCANARDTNVYVLLLLAGVVVIASLASLRVRPRPARGPLWGALLVASSLVAFSAQASWCAKTARRYDFPLMNVIFKRVLTSTWKRDYFVSELKMPLSRALNKRARKWASANRRYAFVAPELQGFRDWLYTDGYSGYQRYLLTHLRSTTDEAYAQLVPVLRFNCGQVGVRARTLLTERVDSFSVSGPLLDFPGLACALIAFLGLLAAIIGTYRQRLLGVLGVFLVLATLSQLYICFHGDAMEVPRHAVVVGLLLRLAVVTGLGLALSLSTALVKRVSHRRAPSPP
jgi:hypothetical protein